MSEAEESETTVTTTTAAQGVTKVHMKGVTISGRHYVSLDDLLFMFHDVKGIEQDSLVVALHSMRKKWDCQS